MRLVVAYDVSDDGRRARLAAKLAMWGDRVQKSVFECLLDDDTFEGFVEELDGLIDPARDVVHLYRQCRPCRDAVVVLGTAEPDPGVRYWVL